MKEQDLNGHLYEADQRLTGVISNFYHIFNPAGAPAVIKHLSPNLEMMLVFNFGPPLPMSFNMETVNDQSVSQIAVLGPVRKMINYELPAGADAIVVNFMLDGFYRLFKSPVTTFSAIDLPDANELINADYLNELWREMAILESTVQRIQLLTDFISSLMSEIEEAAVPLLAGEAYFYDQSVNPVKALASDTGLSERSIQLRFQKYTGYSAKELLRFLRFKAMINHLLQLPDGAIDIFDIVDKYNYHDQSHLIKDFKYFLGVTPQQFIKTLKGKEFCTAGRDNDPIF